MKVTAPTTIILAALFKAVNADFLLYDAGIGGTGIGENSWGYQVYGDEANCDNVIDWIWRSSSDVSGGKYGVRCAGSGDSCDSSGDPTNGLEQIEMNFNSDDKHFTFDASMENGLFDLDYTRIGTCEPVADGAEFFCGAGLGRAEGVLKLRCTTGWNAGDINASKPS